MTKVLASGPGSVTIQNQATVVDPVRDHQRKPNPACLSIVPLTVVGPIGASGILAVTRVDLGSSHAQGIASTQRLSTAVAGATEKPPRKFGAMFDPAQLMVDGVIGRHGDPVARPVGRGRRTGTVGVTTHVLKMAVVIARALKQTVDRARKQTVKLTATGVRGPVGRPALSPVAEERGIERGCATHLRLQRTEDSVPAQTTR